MEAFSPLQNVGPYFGEDEPSFFEDIDAVDAITPPRRAAIIGPEPQSPIPSPYRSRQVFFLCRIFKK